MALFMVFDRQKFGNTLKIFLNQLKAIQLKWICKKVIIGVLGKLL